MAPAVSTLKKQSHPFFTRGPFDITSPKTPVISNGSTYGQLPADSGVAFNDPATGQEINLKVLLLGYGSASMTLTRDNTYMLSGRLICPNLKTPPVLYYEQDLTFPMGPSESLPVSLCNKTAVWGYGIVISKQERDDSALGQNTFRSLFVVMRHTDYDNQSKDQVSFNVLYKIPGNRNLAKTFGLFQIGREMLLSGILSGYDKNEKMFRVQALSVSLSSGPDPTNLLGPGSDTPLVNPRKRYQITFDSDDEEGSESQLPTNSTTESNTVSDVTENPTSVPGRLDAVLAPKKRYNRKTKPDPVTANTPGNSA
ncbi:uncharacterized protein PGTG_10346 [Puccinia graminis f. sp. tritici CRL 75-36-700-3]|uniref:Uncharacterized protein n=1 Tax=Puccinia graminis f. sp. tritici (strain CRL 75-36-700-3 / race SCCL) TaxID=418459 RepID=E3KKQ0_PUCGT|nr:uncharacterized protein PGTG_10346 [Puccinia graminis f. sp. tritici CRL 75-36-700-3]EFP84875.1 hypothetical protein PGTG_10346 [Puccinia graminis f. sp. tritici CRL 75-36-700-3]